MPLEELFRIALVAGVLIVALFSVELAHRRISFPTEAGRKILHIGTGIAILFAPNLLYRALPLATIAALFTILNIVAYSRGWLHSVHQAGRTSFGTVYYPASFLILVLLLWDRASDIVVASMFILALGDGAAAIVGESMRRPHRYLLSGERKSFEGSAMMVAASILAIVIVHECSVAFSSRVALVTSAMVDKALFLLAFALFLSAWEAISPRGLDNLSVPLMSALVLAICLSDPTGSRLQQFSTGAGLALGISVVSYRATFLRFSGSVSTFLLATVVYGFGGWSWTLPVLTFFLLSSILSRVGRRAKAALEANYEKDGRRDAGQVIANGGIAGLVVILSVLIRDERLIFAYLGSIAAVTADTWATEIGAFSRVAPRSIISFRQMEPGSSGAVSVLGTAGSMLGAAVIAATGMFAFQRFSMKPIASILVVVFAGICGSIIDSILGATFQAQYRCAVCGTNTERKSHCGSSTEHFRGFSWMRNDAVNMLCALSGGLLGFVLSTLFV